MKRCPQCHRVETDDSLGFCRTDGVALINDSGSFSGDANTARFGSAPVSSEIETSVLPHRTDAQANRPAAPTTVLQATPTTSPTHNLTKPRRFKFGIAIALVVTVVAAAALILNSYGSRKPDATSIQSIAVLPFVNESGNPEFEYLSDGMTETLINSLSQLPNLSVKARSTVFHYKSKGATAQQVGADLSVQAVLNGRVTQHADQLKLSLELVDTRTGDQIWGDQYNRKAADLVALQTQIAKDVASSLRTKLSKASEAKLARNYTDNPEAYKLYLQGVFYWNNLNGPKAIECFQQAVAIDPNYALAYSGLGSSYVLRLVNTAGRGTTDASEELHKASEYAAKALELDEDLPEAHALMGLLFWVRDYDFAGFARELNRAIELNPRFAEGHRLNGLRLFYLGQFAAARSELQKALDIDPLSNLTNFNYASALIYDGKFDEAESRIRKSLEIDPGFILFHGQLSLLYRLKKDYAAAVEERAKMSEKQNRPDIARLLRESFAKGGWQGYLRAFVGHLEQNNGNPYFLATAYVELGEKDKAFAALEEVYNAHSNFVGYFKIDPELNPLRGDPRFTALLKKSGF